MLELFKPTTSLNGPLEDAPMVGRFKEDLDDLQRFYFNLTIWTSKPRA